MAGEEVQVEWGPFMSSCYITLLKENKLGPMLHISGDVSDSAARLLPGLAKHHKESWSLEEVRSALPPKDAITWSDELKGDAFLGYEIRGHGSDFRAWVQASSRFDGKELDEQQRQELLIDLLRARDLFFPA